MKIRVFPLLLHCILHGYALLQESQDESSIQEYQEFSIKVGVMDMKQSSKSSII